MGPPRGSASSAESSRGPRSRSVFRRELGGRGFSARRGARGTDHASKPRIELVQLARGDQEDEGARLRRGVVGAAEQLVRPPDHEPAQLELGSGCSSTPVNYTSCSRSESICSSHPSSAAGRFPAATLSRDRDVDCYGNYPTGCSRSETQLHARCPRASGRLAAFRARNRPVKGARRSKQAGRLSV